MYMHPYMQSTYALTHTHDEYSILLYACNSSWYVIASCGTCTSIYIQSNREWHSSQYLPACLHLARIAKLAGPKPNARHPPSLLQVSLSLSF
ncbi:hypothetical protein J3F84DRAFT_356445 [Trichoderma pleuroticola]